MQDESFPSIAAAFPVERPDVDDQPTDLILQDGGACEVGTDTATCLENCLPDTQRLQWLAHFPQGHLSVAQGFVGQRMAYFQGSQTQLTAALRDICKSNWPCPPGLSSSQTYCWWKDCLPTDVQYGSAGDERMTPVYGSLSQSDVQTATKLESFGQYRIAVTYQLMHISDPWPIGKPSHPGGTTLTLQVRGGGETLMIDPNAISSGSSKEGISGCFNGREPAVGFKDAVMARMRIPLTEYHITCDRITDAQLCQIFQVPWKCREGTVNCAKFMNEDEGTLLFDTWTLDQTFVPDIDDPRRWRLGVVLKCRQVPGMQGPYPCNCLESQYAIGWNHDYKRHYIVGSNNRPQSAELGWRFIMMATDSTQWNADAAYTPHGTCPSPFVPRYQYVNYDSMFCSGTNNPPCLASIPAASGCKATCPDGSVMTATCNNDGDDNGCAAPPEAAPQDNYTDIQERIAQIVDDARKAKARKIMRDNIRLANGEIDVWPEESKS